MPGSCQGVVLVKRIVLELTACLLLALILCLLFFDSTIVVHEDESVLVLRVGVPLSSCVSWAQVTLGVVLGEGCLGRRFLLPSVEGPLEPKITHGLISSLCLLPWSLCAVW